MATSIVIPLSEERLAQLTTWAAEAKVSPEELLRARVEQWLTQSKEEFVKAANYVLQKNAELYRRLA